jgi:acetyl-CoA C-acetyltransferase
MVQRYTVIHGLVDAPTQYALLENTQGAAGLTTAEELTAVTERNRMIADPYPRLLVARDQVNQGAAAPI